MANRNAILRKIDEWLQPDNFQDYCPNGLQVEGKADVATIVSGVTASRALIDAAIEAYSEAIRLRPSAPAYNNRGIAYFDKGDWQKAIDDYTEAIRARPSAGVALALFAGAALFAWLAWLRMSKPWVFGMLLVITTVHLGFLGVRLIKKPEYKNAKPFYVAGFTFFLLRLPSTWHL